MSLSTGTSGGAGSALQFVGDAHSRFINNASQSLASAAAFAGSLAGFSASVPTINASFNFSGSPGGYQRPTTPTFNADDYRVVVPGAPGAPVEFIPNMPDLGLLPEFNELPPSLAFSPKPNKPTLTAPTAPPRPGLPVMPHEPQWDAPQPVSLLSLNLPVMPTITLPAYTSTRPSAPVFDINDNFSAFTPEQYVSTLLSQIEGRVSTWLVGQEALPAAIEAALFGRGRARIEVERRGLEQQAWDDYGARGFSAPSGLMTSRLDAIRQDAQDKTAEFNRDAMLKSFDEALANMRLAVQSGIQLEGTKIGLHVEMQKLQLQSMAHLRDTSIAILNARIAHFNAEMQGVQIDAQIFETQLKGELSKLDLLRAQIEAEKLKGDVNQQTVELYKTQWGAVKTMAEWYSERVGATKVQMDAAKLPIEIFSEETRAYEAMWGAYAKEIDGWRAEVEGQQAKVSLYKTSADAFASRVQGITSMGGLKNDQERLRIAQYGQTLEQYNAQLRRVDQLVKLEDSRLSAVAQRDRARSDVYRAQADVEQAASAASDRQFNSMLAAARARVDVALEAARLNGANSLQAAALQLEALKAMAQVMSQLAASSMSAVNYSANVSASDNYSRSRGVAWSGDAGDFSPGDV